MPEPLAVSTDIKEAIFAKALVSNNGSATAAYKELHPHVTDSTAKTLGHRYLQKVNRSNIEQCLEDIGATPKIVLAEALKRANKSKGCRDYLDTARLLSKVGGWGENKGLNINLNDNTLEVVDIVRVRLKKATKDRDISQVIDAEVVA